MDTSYKVRLERHIKALDNAYENIISILEEDIEKETPKDGNEEKIKLKDDKIKTYADGIEKASKTADYLLNQIKIKEAELEELNKKVVPVGEKIEVKPIDDSSEEFPLKNHLNG